MPVERDRERTRLRVLEGGLDFGIATVGRDIRVSLAGTLDPDRLQRIRTAVSARLHDRGRAVVLDGAALEHVDYRCATPLLGWHRRLRAFGHRLRLAAWSPRHKLILLLGQDELVQAPLPAPVRCPGP